MVEHLLSILKTLGSKYTYVNTCNDKLDYYLVFMLPEDTVAEGTRVL